MTDERKVPWTYWPIAAVGLLLAMAVDDVFPGGKWATIQHLESLIEEGFPDA